nr:MAG TPA: hypothetical protein [Caudoviricetes sp.]
MTGGRNPAGFLTSEIKNIRGIQKLLAFGG